MQAKGIPIGPLRHQRRRRSVCCVALAALLVSSYAAGEWDGKNGTATLPYLEAVAITRDESQGGERRKAAILRVFSATEYAGKALREAEQSNDPLISKYARETRERIVAQWR